MPKAETAPKELGTISLFEAGNQLTAVFRPPLAMAKLFDVTASKRPILDLDLAGSDRIRAIVYERQAFEGQPDGAYQNFVNFHQERLDLIESARHKLGYELVEGGTLRLGQHAVSAA